MLPLSRRVITIARIRSSLLRHTPSTEESGSTCVRTVCVRAYIKTDDGLPRVLSAVLSGNTYESHGVAEKARGRGDYASLYDVCALSSRLPYAVVSPECRCLYNTRACRAQANRRAYSSHENARRLFRRRPSRPRGPAGGRGGSSRMGITAARHTGKFKDMTVSFLAQPRTRERPKLETIAGSSGSSMQTRKRGLAVDR